MKLNWLYFKPFTIHVLILVNSWRKFDFICYVIDFRRRGSKKWIIIDLIYIYRHNKIAYGMNMKYCIIPGWRIMRYMNSNLLLINRFGNFFFVILYVDIYNLISWLQNDKSIIKVYDFIQNIPHSYDKLSHIYNNITFGFEYAIIVVKSRVDHK